MSAMPVRRLTLFTSIPPASVRRDRAGIDIGADYQRRCISSWRAAGHRLISLNGVDEAARVAALYPDVEVRPVARTAFERTGRPLVPIAELLRECAAESDGRVGLINADLYLHAPGALAKSIEDADDATVVYGRRLDVDDIDAPVAMQTYFSGLDGFFFAPSAARDLPDEGFVLGETWWDYWLPVVLAKRGCRLKPATDPIALHLRHDESAIGMRAPTYLEYFHGFARALSVRLPLPGEEPWAIAARPLLAAFMRRYRPAAETTLQIYLSQFLSLTISLYLMQSPALADTLAAAWRPLLDHAPNEEARSLIRELLDSTAAAGAS